MSSLVDYYDDLWKSSGIPPYVQSIFPAIAELNLHSDSKVLDIACGNGVLGNWIMNQVHCDVYGIDISPVALDLCKQLGYKDTKIVDLDKDSLPYPNNYFNLVTLSAVVEHIMDPEKVLQDVWNKLKPGGSVIVLTPNICWVINRLLFLLGYWEHRLMGGMKGHINYMNKKRLEQIFVNNGYVDVKWGHSVYCVAGNSKVCQSGITGYVIKFLHNRPVKYFQSLLAFNFVVTAYKPINK